MPTTEQLRTRFVDKLRELFQLDQPDLDFGFYRIMHAKAAQVQSFIEKDLLAIVTEEFSKTDGSEIASLQVAYDHALEQAKEYNVSDPEESPPVKKARQALDGAKERGTSEGEVYDHLYRFFERYYDDGDFISRRYSMRETAGKAAPFTIPYNGEEVKLYWANADQYYIKTAEFFSNYGFDLRQAKEVREQQEKAKDELELSQRNNSPLPIHFRIVDATEGEHGNVKATDASKRFFRIHSAHPVELTENGEPVINFEYRPDPDKTGKDDTWREKRNNEAVELALATLSMLAESRVEIQEYILWLKHPVPLETDKKRILFNRYVNQFTARNTTDYFIHKDLGQFLRRELDFYIKNEVMRLDDIENSDAPAVESYLKKVKALRRIAQKLIDFLAQLEDFQKRLWLKRKFVVDTQYCITLDRVPESLYSEIAVNNAQREEWIKLFAIDEIEGDLAKPGYSVPLTVDFLKANDKLVLDTLFFGDTFKASLVKALENLDEQCDGVLLNSDNFQALRLLADRYHNHVRCVYIDPPYNTSSSSIPYKNDYKHSSFAAMMYDRIAGLNHLLQKDGALFVSIDKTERTIVEGVLNAVFGSENRIEELIWSMNTNNSQAPNYSTNHEYVLVYAKDKPTVEKDKNMFREPKPGYEEVMALIEELNPCYPPISEIEGALGTLYEQHRVEFRDAIESQGLEWEVELSNDPWKGLFNYSRAEYRNEKGQLVLETNAEREKAHIWVWREGDASMPATKQATSTRDSHHKNWRFYTPLHPKTGQPCPSPKSGWKFAYDDDEDSPERRSFVALDRDSRIVWGADEKKVPQIKRMLHEVETNVGKSVFVDYSDGEKETSAMFGRSGIFLSPKHSDFVTRFIRHATKTVSIVVDCFGGSGSTGHAVIKLNREDEGHRKYILAEMNTYFDFVMKPRILKAVYSNDWRSGKPIKRQGISQTIKILRLESYEDTLNNLRFEENPLRAKAIAAEVSLKEDFMLHYMLDVETRGSQSLLNISDFADPTGYRLMVKKPGSEEQVPCTVDLLETFNYLIGMRVEHITEPVTYTAEFDRPPDEELPDQADPETRDTKLVLKPKGSLKKAADGKWWFRTVEGWVPRDPENPNGAGKEKVLVVWRRLTGNIEEDNLVLDEWFLKNRYNPRDFEFDTIYVNGSNNLPNLRQEGDRWKVRLIEEDFMKRMWDIEIA